MSASDLPSPARVLVFAPYLEEDGALLSPHYDPPEYRAEIGSWLEAMGMDWEWVPAASRVNIRPVLRLSAIEPAPRFKILRNSVYSLLNAVD